MRTYRALVMGLLFGVNVSCAMGLLNGVSPVLRYCHDVYKDECCTSRVDMNDRRWYTSQKRSCSLVSCICACTACYLGGTEGISIPCCCSAAAACITACCAQTADKLARFSPPVSTPRPAPMRMEDEQSDTLLEDLQQLGYVCECCGLVSGSEIRLRVREGQR